MIKRGKNAQATIFIIIAILIVAVAILFFIFNEKITKSLFEQKTQEIASLPPQVQNVYYFVESCIENSASDVLYAMGQQGGYFIPSDLSTNSNVGYYVINGKSYLPSQRKLENEISQYVSQELFFCVNDFSDFNDLDVRQGDIEIITKIKGSEVVLNVNYPLLITSEDSTSLLEEFETVKIPTRLGTIYNVTSLIVQDQVDNPNEICLSCLINFGIENDLLIDMFNYDENTIVFSLRDENSIINNKPYEFKFAIKNE